MDETLKVAIVIRSFNRGGAEVLIREMFENAEFNKHIKNCDLIILDGKEIELLKDLKNINYYIFNIFSSSFFGFFKEFIKLRKFISEKKYKIIHTHLPFAGIIVRLLKFLQPQIKLVYSEHCVLNAYNKLSFLLNGLTYTKNDYTVFVSAAVKHSVDDHKALKFYTYKKGAVINNGVNSNKFFCPSKNGHFTQNYLTVGTVASMRKQKRLDRWIEVAEFFKRNYPDTPVKFIIAGDGSERKALQELILLKGLDRYIELAGLVINTVPFYNAIDIFLMTSEFEGLPVALLEAMSCGCIPVTSNVGGIRNLDFDDFGYKYENFNAEGLAKIIFQYYNDKTKIVEERKRARNFILRNNSLDKQVQEYIHIYNNL
jgi:glycosyltransferase involved in cell wall biosynthesis